MKRKIMSYEDLEKEEQLLEELLHTQKQLIPIGYPGTKTTIETCYSCIEIL
jgi:hypothetical protein